MFYIHAESELIGKAKAKSSLSTRGRLENQRSYHGSNEVAVTYSHYCKACHKHWKLMDQWSLPVKLT